MSAMCLLLYLASATAEPCHKLSGDYLEARTCDVWTGPCFSNSEVNTTGEFAVLGWAAKRGTWQGEELSGLRIAAAIRAEGTLSTENEGRVKAVVFVDERATPEQEKALLGMARGLAGRYLEDIIEVRRAKIDFSSREGETKLEIRDLLGVRTTPLTCHDRHCGNETVAYPSLARTKSSDCVKTVEHFFRGEGLQARWSDPHKRSAILGSFTL